MAQRQGNTEPVAGIAERDHRAARLGFRAARALTTRDALTVAVLLACSAGIDMLVRPRTGTLRHPVGLWLLSWTTLALFGLFLTLCGAVVPAAVLALAGPALFAVASNAKNAMLGEPLVFSDLALVGAIFRHPQFYLSALQLWQKVVICVAGGVLLAILAYFFVPVPWPHVIGAVLLAAALLVLWGSLGAAMAHGIASVPDLDGDVRRYGLIATLLLYWRQWRRSENPAPAPLFDAATAGRAGVRPKIIVIVQCESFADPAELFLGTRYEQHACADLPGLSAARTEAVQWGNLNVSGFGAYTMRTEYGVLFGRGEAELQFRQYDPFLTARGEVSYALPSRLNAADPDWRSYFLHPHDMRFYGRDKIMPEAGFTELFGEDRFKPPVPGEGRYVTDAAIADEILALAATVSGPSMIYAVTIENHGPWSPHEPLGEGETRRDLVGSYLHFVRHSDTMLTRLTEGLRQLDRSALLVFFGDHRPSIPGVSDPGLARHTPYVILQIDGKDSAAAEAGRQEDLTPAGLHRAILRMALE